jgi:dual specificity MAP kinase phosphatase
MMRHVLNHRLTISDTFNVVQDKYPSLIAIDSAGDMTGEVADFCE